MVARTPPKQRRMVAPLDPTLLRETVNKVDKCMARLQELEYITGGTKVISGVSLSPRSTRGYLRTSLRCKQESLRIRNANGRKSPPGKLPTNTGDWRRMSLPAMLLGETVGAIIQASQFARETVAALEKKIPTGDPKTPVTSRRNSRPTPENSELRARRKREKQIILHSIRSEKSDNTPSLQRAKSRINFKVSPPRRLSEKDKENIEKENCRYLANRVSPKNRPWARKTVLFPNPLFHSSPTSQNQKFSKTSSPVIARNQQTPRKFLIKSPSRNRQTPHKFLIKSPEKSKFQVKIKSPPVSLSSPTRPTCLSKRSPPKQQLSTAAKLRRSFSPSRLANRLVSLSPLKSRKSVQRKSDASGMMMMMSGLKQRPNSTPMQLSARRI